MNQTDVVRTDPNGEDTAIIDEQQARERAAQSDRRRFANTERHHWLWILNEQLCLKDKSRSQETALTSDKGEGGN
jgi:hypothetical protein